ncbi:hypothetical protein TL16_g04307 [Triparma laevis f. inornata]|uniref:Uncharacterized protein n=1 Tax=Triparma laevis f. inornata TaxID=1714386 RepID=A0A9W7A966_9STRA|nr:hypothetical protein TL16_g04307 [Triparma laevis f. inornata]
MELRTATAPPSLHYLDQNPINNLRPSNTMQQSFIYAQANLSLTSTLIYTIEASFLLLADTGGESAVSGDTYFVAIMISSCACTAVTTLMSSVFILGANLMKSSNDMHELLNKLDGFHRAPYISFFLGLFLFFAGVGHWILSVINIDMNYNNWQGWGIVGLFIGFATPIFLYPSGKMVQNVHLISEANKFTKELKKERRNCMKGENCQYR